MRLTQKKFTVSVVGIITNKRNEILILDHFFRLHHTWGLPGGFIGPFEPPEDAIRREIKEEADLELEDLRLVRIRNAESHIEILFRANGIGEAKVNSKEIKEVGWFSIHNLPEISNVQVEILRDVIGTS